MDGQLSRKKVIGSPIYEESLERTFVEGIERFGMFQARKYLEHLLTTVEKLENDYPYYPECRHLTTKSRMYRNIILDSHLIIYRITEERIEVLEKMVLRLYEDMVAGRITENNFDLLLAKTQKEQAELKEKAAEARKRLDDEARLAVDAREWVESIQEYRDIAELDAATLNRLIKEIVVHETVDSDKTRHISIEIHFNLKPLPEVEQVTG